MKAHIPSRLHLVGRASALLALFVLAANVDAGLIMEPVINRVEDSGVAFAFGVCNLDLQGANDFPIATACAANAIATYVAGEPRDPFLDFDLADPATGHPVNNTRYEMDGFHIRIAGSATGHEIGDGPIARMPVDATWGDVDGDGRIGQSDIFGTITVSVDGTTISLTDGIVPPGMGFTDIHLAAMTVPGETPLRVALDSWFTGIFIPEPSTFALGLAGLVGLAILRCHRRSSRSA
jgi:hypothetical protein